MSSELLLNFDKNTAKSSALTNKSVKISDSEKKESGNSLFDSIMKQVKQDTTSDSESISSQKSQPDNSSEKEIPSKPILNKDSDAKSILNVESVISDTENIEEKTDKPNSETKSTLNTNLSTKNIESSEDHDNLNLITKSNTEIKVSNIEIQDGKEDKLFDTKKVASNNTFIDGEKLDKESIQKLVDKLVNIVVSAANDISNNKSDKPIDTKVLTDTVEKIVESKISDLIEQDTLKTTVDKNLNIVSESIKVIKNEAENILKSNDITKEQDTRINNEVTLIKDSVKTIQNKLSSIENNETLTVKLDNDKSNDLKVQFTGEINKELLTLDDNSKDIKKLLNSDSLNENLKELEIKIEHKTNTMEDSVLNIKEKVSETVIVTTLQKENIDTISKIVENTKEIDENLKKPLLAAMFLTAQKITKNQTSLEQVQDVKSVILEKQSLESVKEGAVKLDLNIDDSEVSYEEEEGIKPIVSSKSNDVMPIVFGNNSSLNKALFNEKTELDLSLKEQTILTSKDINATKNIDIVELTVPKEIVSSFQSKIIGAQQKMGTFMNDIARNMYLNYKPPVTAFRVNLNPANLGSISIIMRANKVDNSLSVSMNLSNSNTMEAFTENKVALQTAIQRQFNESSNVSIDFNMADQNSENEFNQSNNNQDNNRRNNEDDKQSESENSEEQEIIENNDYM